MSERYVVMGAGEVGFYLASALSREGHNVVVVETDPARRAEVKIIERDRPRAEELAARFPDFEILHGDSTDLSLLRAEWVADARSFIALMGNDERNLLANLLAQELGVEQVVALVERTETSHLWRRLGHMRIVSPRRIAADRIKNYIRCDYSVGWRRRARRRG